MSATTSPPCPANHHQVTSTARHARRCAICAACALCDLRPNPFNSSLTSCASQSTANTTSVSCPAALSSHTILTLSDFSNIIRKSSLERLAEADDHEVVRAVHEYFADYLVINPDLMSLNLQPRIWSNNPDLWNPDALQRSTEGVIAMLLSLKKKPLIRYQKNSLLAKKLATEVRYQMTQEEQLFDFRKTDTSPILLIVDRRDDPVTPLLTQWTYQAMVHELLGVNNGRVDLSDVSDIRPELKVSRLSVWRNRMLTLFLRKSHFPKTRTLSSRRTCISTLEILARMPRITSSNLHQNSKAV